MLTKTLPIWRVSPVVLLFAVAAGCTSDRKVTVTGKLVLPANVKINDTDTVTISFIPEDKDKKTAAAKFASSDNSFTATDVTPGKNKISVSFVPYPGKDQQQHAAAFEPLNQKYSGAGSTLIYDVGPSGSQSITIDLAKGTVSKG